MKRALRSRVAVALVGLSCVLCLYIVARALSGSTSIQSLKSGGSIKIISSSFRARLHGAQCAATISSKSGKVAELDFLQSYFCSPIIFFPSSDENVFFCLYDNDVDVQLIKINIGRSPLPGPADQVLKTIVLKSTCEIERVHKAETNDWNFASQVLQRMPASEYRRNVEVFGSFGFYTSQKTLLKSVQNNGDQGQYNGETMIPWYLESNNVSVKR